jgi:hypothetical protein
MDMLQEVFDDRIISGKMWPPRSPDLSLSVNFLWGFLKDNAKGPTNLTSPSGRSGKKY